MVYCSSCVSPQVTFKCDLRVAKKGRISQRNWSNAQELWFEVFFAFD